MTQPRGQSQSMSGMATLGSKASGPKMQEMAALTGSAPEPDLEDQQHGITKVLLLLDVSRREHDAVQ